MFVEQLIDDGAFDQVNMHQNTILAIICFFADSLSAARKVAAAVKVTYKNRKKPLLTTREAIECKSFYDLNIPDVLYGDPDEAITAAPHVVSNAFVANVILCH